MASDSPCPLPYHERQRLRRCGLHSVNALLGYRAHSASSFSQLARELCVSSPAGFRTWLQLSGPLGNYDVTLLIAALRQHGRAVRWVRPQDVPLLVFAEDALRGFLLNVERGKIGWMGQQSGRHWLALVQSAGLWYIVDSERSGPVTLHSLGGVVQYVFNILDAGGQALSVWKDEEAMCENYENLLNR